MERQILGVLSEIADLRIHGTTHEQPIARFAAEAAHLVPTASQASFLAATIRDRVVASDWLISIDANRYSVPFHLVGRTVDVSVEGGDLTVRFAGTLVAEHRIALDVVDALAARGGERK